MEPRQLSAALAVARHGTFTGAAKALFVAQPTVSRYVTELEREIGLLLFTRGPRSVDITAGGRAFLVEAQAVLAAIERAQRVAAQSRPPAGESAGQQATTTALPRRAASLAG